MAAQTDENGVLAQIVQQVSDNSPFFDQDRGELVEKWKGPYAVMKDYPQAQFKPGKLREACIPPTALTRIAVPQPPAGKSWIVDSVKIQEIEAGDHCIMTVKYAADVWTGGGGGGGGSAVDDEKDDIWTLQWQAYSVSPFRYCANDYRKNPLTPDKEARDIPQSACRGRIENFIHYKVLPPEKLEISANTDWCYKVPSAKATTSLSAGLYCLTLHEREIYKKISDGVQPIFHYPVLTHQTSKYYTGELSSIQDKTYPDDIGDKIDTKADPLRNCPYTFGDSPAGRPWEWIKTGDTMVQVKTSHKNKFTRIETWEGSLSVDLNFYSADSSKRWQFGDR